MLTVVCFVFRGKAGSGSDEDADCIVFCVQENVRMSQTVSINNNYIWRVINAHYYYY